MNPPFRPIAISAGKRFPVSIGPEITPADFDPQALSSLRPHHDGLHANLSDSWVARALLTLINDILDLSKVEAGKLERTLASRSLRTSLQIDGAGAPDGSRFLVIGEELLCHSMLSNILKNAVEASPDGEVIATAVANTSPRTIRIRNSSEVPESMRDRFFEKYVTSGKERGTGLGTYSAKLIAETQGGGIRRDTSEPGCTTIEVQLPSADPA